MQVELKSFTIASRDGSTLAFDADTLTLTSTFTDGTTNVGRIPSLEYLLIHLRHHWNMTILHAEARGANDAFDKLAAVRAAVSE